LISRRGNVDIPFTQFMLPNGRKVPVTIDRPDAVALKAGKVIARGGQFACEVLTTGGVSFTVEYDDEDICIEVCQNGPQVFAAVDRLVEEACRYFGLEV
jgi:hypothetical protein